MILFKILFILCFVLYWINADKNKLLIISFDGFRWDFLQRGKLENFQWIIKNGISAKWMEPVFITKTFSTHFSMATGLYVENHGIVGNEFYDSSFNEKFDQLRGSKEAKWWSRGEPMWITATNHKIRSAVSFWPGSEVDYNGVKPEQYVIFDKTKDAKTRIDQAIQWFLSGIRFVSFYYSQPDNKEHAFGPDSTEVNEEIKRVDEVLGYALNQLRANKLFETTNIIVVGDHGHEQIKHVVYLNDSAKPFDFSLIKRVESEGIWFSFELKDGLDAASKNKFLNDLQNHLGSNYQLFKSRDEIPERWHYRGAANRVPNYNVFSKPGYEVLLYERRPIKGGDHGYDNTLSNMKPIFMAYGPDFRNKPRKVKEVHQVDLYGIALKLLGLNDLSIKNGSITRIKEIISHANLISNQVKELFIFMWIFLIQINFISSFF